MSCGVNIPLESIVNALVTEYADTFAEEVLRRVDLTTLQNTDNKTFLSPTIKGGITLDADTISALCGYMSSCISAKLDELLGCNIDNHVSEFFIDKTTDKLTIKLLEGEVFSISKQELLDWLDFTAECNCPQLVDGELTGNYELVLTFDNGNSVKIDLSSLNKTHVDTYLTEGTLQGTDLILTRNDGGSVTIDLSSLAIGDGNTYITNATLELNNLVLFRNDGTTLRVALPQTGASGVDTDTYPTRLSLNDKTLVLTLNTGTSLEVDLTPILPVATDTDTKLVSGRIEGDKLILVNSDNSQVEVAIGQTGQGGQSDLDVCKATVVNSDGNYTVNGSNLGTNTVVRLTGNTSQLTLATASDDFIGASITVRDVFGGGTGYNVVLDGVTTSPDLDFSTLMRTVGATFTFMYVGNNTYDVYGG